MEQKTSIEPADSLKLKVCNNGGEVIKVGSSLYYDGLGEGLYSDGRYLYGTQNYEDASPSAIFRYRFDGSGYKRLMEGRITGMSEDRKILYYISNEETEEAENGVFAGAMDLETEETRILSVFHGFSMAEISCAYGNEQRAFFSAGSYEGSAGCYYGNFYYADFATEELKEMHLTDADKFWIADEKVYYQKYDYFGESGNDRRKEWKSFGIFHERTGEQMSYVPKEGTENQTYLLGKTEHYTLYGKGNQEQMLLESEGAYAKIRYTYTSNYMTPLELLEADLDGDGQILAGAELQFLQDEIGAFYGSNGTEICGVVNWTPEEGFVLSEITGRQS